MTDLFYSTPAKIMMLVAIPAIIITQLYQFSTYAFIMQLLMYFFVAFNAECLVEGNCKLWAWLSISFPILYSLLYIFFGNQLSLSPSPPRPPTIIMPISYNPPKDVQQSS